MNHHRRFWDEILVTLEESLAAFSGVNPDFIDAPATIPKLVAGIVADSALRCKHRRFAQDTAIRKYDRNNQQMEVKRDGE